MTDMAELPLRALVEVRRDEIKAIVSRHGGRSVALFGSVARGDEQPTQSESSVKSLTREPAYAAPKVLLVLVVFTPYAGLLLASSYFAFAGKEFGGTPQSCLLQPMRP